MGSEMDSWKIQHFAHKNHVTLYSMWPFNFVTLFFFFRLVGGKSCVSFRLKLNYFGTFPSHSVGLETGN